MSEANIKAEHQVSIPLRVLDLFAGAGGLAYGFEHFSMPCGCSAYQLAAAVERDPHACETLRTNYPHLGKEEADSKVIEGDLTFPETHSKVLELVSQEGVQIMIGGPPCQSYSYIGTRSGKWAKTDKSQNDKRDRLFEEYVSLVKELSPFFVVIENVDGIRSKKDESGRPYLSVIIELLEAEGYQFKIAGLEHTKFLRLNAASYGVPQVRNRIFLIGNRLGLEFISPAPTHYDPSVPSDERPEGATQQWVTLSEAIGDLPEVHAHYTKTNLTEEEWVERQRQNEKRQNGCDEAPYHVELFNKHYELVSDSGRQFLDFIKPSNGFPLKYHRARDQQSSDIELFGLMPEGATAKEIFDAEQGLSSLAHLIRYDMSSFKDKYRKQRWDKPGTTIFAHLERDGNRFIHPDSTQARTFTVREAARIQGFPDDYELAGSLKSRYRQIGNAVPPLLSLAIAKAIHKTLDSGGILKHSCGEIG